MKPETTPEPEALKPFTHFLQMFQGGKLNSDLGDELRELNAKISELAATQGKAKGTLSLELNLQMKDKLLVVTPVIKVKAPKVPLESEAFWLTKKNQLSADNPAQLNLKIRSLPNEGVRNDLAADAADRKG